MHLNLNVFCFAFHYIHEIRVENDHFVHSETGEEPERRNKHQVTLPSVPEVRDAGGPQKSFSPWAQIMPLSNYIKLGCRLTCV